MIAYQTKQIYFKSSRYNVSKVNLFHFYEEKKLHYFFFLLLKHTYIRVINFKMNINRIYHSFSFSRKKKCTCINFPFPNSLSTYPHFLIKIRNNSTLSSCRWATRRKNQGERKEKRKKKKKKEISASCDCDLWKVKASGSIPCVRP